jgi:protein-tyrosine-phosphatase
VSDANVTIYPSLAEFVEKLRGEFDLIPSERKKTLRELSLFIRKKNEAGEKSRLVFICTHNSRRSHIAQIWAQAASVYFGIQNVVSYSGGTEATAFNTRAVKAMVKAGFEISRVMGEKNPVYNVQFAETAEPLMVFSKVYNESGNPTKQFCAVMTCSHADQNCPIVMGAEKRISLSYDDPKDFDDTADETLRYDERVRQIGREILYAFSLVLIP